MITINVHEAKARFSKYIELAENGETVIVCKRNVPVAEIRMIAVKTKKKRILGTAEGLGEITHSFDRPMSADELACWEGLPDDPLKEYAPKPGKRSRK